MLPSIPHICGYMGKVWQAWKIVHTLGSCSSNTHNTQAEGPDLVRTAKQWYHPQVGVYWCVNNHMPWIHCHSFHISCGCCMGNIRKSWDTINTLGSCSSKPQNTQAMGPEDLVRTIIVKQWCHPQGGVCCYIKNHMSYIYCHPFHISCGYMS